MTDHSNSCTELTKQELDQAAPGTVSCYCVPPGLADLPNGWQLFGADYLAVMPSGDEIEGINPYQPDVYRVVMIVKS